LKTAKSKACSRYLDDSKELNRPHRGPCPGSEKIGCEEIWKRRNQDVRIISQSNLVKMKKTDWVSFMIKLLRAYGECLGARRR
jgi:hypothetical protein